MSEPGLELRDLEISYLVRGVPRPVLRGVSLSIGQGEAFGLVGESGCGKSTLAFAIARYLPENARVDGGSISLRGRDVSTLGEREVRRLRASEVSMVYQNPGAALNPSLRIDRQLTEAFELCGHAPREAGERAVEMLAKVRIAHPERVMRRYPHQLSGGMQQRVVIAMALAKEPKLLILDEPTTGLDATVEAEVLDLVAALQEQTRTSVLFISHNLPLVSRICVRVGVLYAGRLVEEGRVEEVLHEPRHPYTVGLMRCVPQPGTRRDRERLDTIAGVLPPLGAQLPGCVFADRCDLADERCRAEEPPLIEVGAGQSSRCWYHEIAESLPRADVTRAESGRSVDYDEQPIVSFSDLSKTYRQHGQDVNVLDRVSAGIWPGETLGLVGESGSGKTTLAHTLLGLVEPDEDATIELDARPLAGHVDKRSRSDIRAIQIVFQNPGSALNRRVVARRIVGRALTTLLGLKGDARERRVRELADDVRFDQRYLATRPVRLSGGLQQRLAIARAFAGNPRLIVCDEPTSALDVSVQAAILNLLVDLQTDKDVAYLFISHDLGVVRYVSDRIAVLYRGRLLELGAADVVFEAPQHPYTEALLAAVPSLDEGDGARARAAEETTSESAPTGGCIFQARCQHKLGAICEQQQPPLAEVEPGRFMSCHIPLDELRALQCSSDPPADDRRTPAPSDPPRER